MSFPNSVKELFYSSEYFQKPLKFKEDRNRICPGLACHFRCVCKSLSAAQTLDKITVKRGNFLEEIHPHSYCGMC